MRIIGGIYKRRIIHAPKNLPVRPTTDKAKESLFNILNNQIDFDGIVALDLFAGTGNISFELASRGCQSVTSVDKDFGCIKFINKVKNDLALDNLKAIRMDAFRFILSSPIKYDLIFADPPYKLESITDIVAKIFEKNLLNDDGMLIIEHPDTIDFSDFPGFYDHRNYSRVNFSFFRNNLD